MRKNQKKMNSCGFTLVELIIILAVMAFLAALVIPNMSGVMSSFDKRVDEATAEIYLDKLVLHARMGNIPETEETTIITEALIREDLNDDGDLTDTVDFGINANAFTYTFSDRKITVHCGDITVYEEGVYEISD